MIIIHNFNQSLESYVECGVNNYFPEIEQCPHCKAKERLYKHGFYSRNAIKDDNTYLILIRRLKCLSCNKTVSILPDFLIPYYQNTLTTVINRIRDYIIKRKINGVRQLVEFYVKRFLSQLKQIEMFFRREGMREKLPFNRKERAIKLLEMIISSGPATFLRRSKDHFGNNFMAPLIAN